MRIISGKNKGRRLAALEARDIRPTSDRVREAVFNIIFHRVEGARVLDLFAGTGALGLEALSRGAAQATFLDISRQACGVIQDNIERCRATREATLICHDLSGGALPAALSGGGFSLIFMDPPYGRDLIEETLCSPVFPRLLAPHGLVIVEHSPREPLPDPIKSLDISDQRKYGKTLISFLAPAGQGPVQ